MAEFNLHEIVKVKFTDGTPSVYAKITRVITPDDDGVEETLYQVWETENETEFVEGEAGWYSRYYANELEKVLFVNKGAASLKDFDDTATPNVMNRDADNGEHAAAVKPVKLSMEQQNALHTLAKYARPRAELPVYMQTIVMNTGFVSASQLPYSQVTFKALVRRGLAENEDGNQWRIRLTDAGRTYATERGWLASASAQPDANVTPADYAAVEAMGEVAENVQTDTPQSFDVNGTPITSGALVEICNGKFGRTENALSSGSVWMVFQYDDYPNRLAGRRTALHVSEMTIVDETPATPQTDTPASANAGEAPVYPQTEGVDLENMSSEEYNRWIAPRIAELLEMDAPTPDPLKELAVARERIAALEAAVNAMWAIWGDEYIKRQDTPTTMKLAFVRNRQRDVLSKLDAAK